ALYAYGDALGIAFQIVDDLLDWQGGAGIGKNIGDDFREGKLTMPVIRAIAAGDTTDTVFWTRTLEKRVQETGDLEHALALLQQHGTLDSTRDDALMWAERAKDALNALPDHEIKGMLTDLADYVVARLV
ncbi:MAG: octaprenyl-diphosphate synthase, partial [Loktanella salsilacus]